MVLERKTNGINPAQSLMTGIDTKTARTVTPVWGLLVSEGRLFNVEFWWDDCVADLCCWQMFGELLTL